MLNPKPQRSKWGWCIDFRIRGGIWEPIRLGRNRYEIAGLPVDEANYLGEWRCPLRDRGGQSASKLGEEARGLTVRCVAVLAPTAYRT